MTNWVIDLDGVMWRGPVAIPGSAAAVVELLGRGDRVVFCTNNSTASGAGRAAQLAERGVPEGAEVLTSADALCRLVDPAERVLVVGSAGLLEALAAHGAATKATAELVADGVVPHGPGGPGRFDAVVVGLARGFDYPQLDLARAAVAGGARLLATNTDPTYPGSDGIHVGTGAIVAAVETATGVTATVAGKPHRAMADLIAEHLGLPDPGLPEYGLPDSGLSGSVVVGDQPATDGRLAESLGVPYLQVLSGVTAAQDLPADVPIAAVAEDLAAHVAGWRGGAGPSDRGSSVG